MFKRRYDDLWIYFSLFFMSVFGAIMIGSASIGSAEQMADPNFATRKIFFQGIFIVASFAAMIVAKKMTRKKMFSDLWALQVMGGSLLIFMVAPRIFGVQANGSYAWIPIPFINVSVQPSEFVKLYLIIALAYIFGELPKSIVITNTMSYNQAVSLKKKRIRLCLNEPAMVILVAFLVCLLIQKDLGSSAVILAVSLVCFFNAANSIYQKPQKRVLIGIIIFVVIFALFNKPIIAALPTYMRNRFNSWLHPLDDVYGASYQLLNGMISFVTNGLTGAGFNNSTQKFGYIPEAYNDFISAIIFEELGFFGLFCMVVPNCIIIFKLINYSFKVKDTRSRIILFGVASYFFSHLILNIGGVTGFIPMTGIPLLCISAGGSSSVAAYMGIGMAQSIIAKYNAKKHGEVY